MGNASSIGIAIASIFGLGSLGVSCFLALLARTPLGRTIREDWVPSLQPPVVIKGQCKEGYEKVKEAFEKNFRLGYDVGAYMTFYHNGECVVDLKGGYARMDPDKVLEDEFMVVFSCGKVVESIVVAMLVDRGKLAYSEPIAKYWPEFAVNGKDQITVSNLMRHQAGLLGLHPLATNAILKDHDALAKLLAAQKPFWPQNCGKQGYMAITRGMYVNELVRRVDGRSIERFIQDEIVKPLKIQYTIAGVSDPKQVARHYTIRAPAIGLDVFLFQLLLPPWLRKMFYGRNAIPEKVVAKNYQEMKQAFQPAFKEAFLEVCKLDKSSESYPANDPHWRELQMSSSTGLSNSSSLAKLAMLMANGGIIDGVRLLGEDAVRQACSFEGCKPIRDEVLGTQIKFSQGGVATLVDSTWVGWAGAGGSYIIWNVQEKAAFSFVPSCLEPLGLKVRADRILDAASKTFKKKLETV